MSALPPAGSPHPENCPKCDHLHLGAANCFYSTARDNLCLCKEPQTMKSLPEIVKANAKGNGKDEETVIVEGNPVARRARKVAKAFAPSKAPKDQYLPGTAPKTISSVHIAIEEYDDAERNRARFAALAKEKLELVARAMKKHDITTYAVDGHEAEIETDEKVKVKLRGIEDEEQPSSGEPRELRVRGRKSHGRVDQARA